MKVTHLNDIERLITASNLTREQYERTNGRPDSYIEHYYEMIILNNSLNRARQSVEFLTNKNDIK